MDTASHSKLDAIRGTRVAKSSLELRSRANRIERIVKDRVGSVAGHLHDLAVVCLDARPRQHVVPRETGGHPLRMLLP